jgi:DNA polymerase III epsilon subunit-like protein
MPYYNKVLWLDTETSGLDPKVTNILELAWMKEVNGQLSSIQKLKVQPIFHYEDHLFGPQAPNGFQDINDFCIDYNKKIASKHDPDNLRTFAFPNGSPLFAYASSALTFNVQPPDINNPMDWVIGGAMPAQQALQILQDDLGESSGRWILAGHNISFDYEVLYWWSRRLLGQQDASSFINKINKFVFLDTLDLVRWFQYSGRLPEGKGNLSNIASHLELKIDDAHTADVDVALSNQVAKLLLTDTDEHETDTDTSDDGDDS